MKTKNTKQITKWEAIGYVRAALKKGKLLKSICCERCNKHTRQLHAHHEDYQKPLSVIWLCPACHLGYSGIHGNSKTRVLEAVGKNRSEGIDKIVYKTQIPLDIINLLKLFKITIKNNGHSYATVAEKISIYPSQLSEWLHYKRCPSRASERKIRNYIGGYNADGKDNS